MGEDWRIGKSSKGTRNPYDKKIQITVGVRKSMIKRMVGDKPLAQQKQLVQEIILNQLKAKFGESSSSLDHHES